MARILNWNVPTRLSGNCALNVLTSPANCIGVSVTTRSPSTSCATTSMEFASQSPPGSMGQPQVMRTVARVSVVSPGLKTARVGSSKVTVNP